MIITVRQKHEAVFDDVDYYQCSQTVLFIIRNKIKDLW